MVQRTKQVPSGDAAAGATGSSSSLKMLGSSDPKGFESSWMFLLLFFYRSDLSSLICWCF